MPGNIGWQGIVIILLVLLLIFGPKRLPEMGRSIGHGIREFKDSLTGKDDEPERVEIAEPASTVTSESTVASEDRTKQPEGERVSSSKT
jgi:sec-independent protein translocase protein TatA